MQWDDSVNHGFSEGKEADLYLPVDLSEDAPTVAAQTDDPASLLNTVRALLALRHREEDLQADADLQVICSEADKPLVYRRGSLLCVLNPSGRKLEASLPAGLVAALQSEVIFQIGDAFAENGKLYADAQSFAVLK